jgi:hypothetical protein
LFFKLDKCQEILMSIATTQQITKNELPQRSSDLGRQQHALQLKLINPARPGQVLIGLLRLPG